MLPFGLAVISSFFLAVSNIIAKRSEENGRFSFVVWSSIFAWPLLLVLSLLTEDHGAMLPTHPSRLEGGGGGCLSRLGLHAGGLWPVERALVRGIPPPP
ncbi:MAG: hypothetical protein U1E15_00370 [Hyphomicrobiales bacterium]